MSDVPPREDCVLLPLLSRWAGRQPDKRFALFAGRPIWSYAEMLAATRAAGAGLQRLGVGPGDRVLPWLANGPEALRTWFGANAANAVYIPVNTAYKGQLLDHVVRNADTRVAMVHPELLPRVAQIDHGLGSCGRRGHPPPPERSSPKGCSAGTRS